MRKFYSLALLSALLLSTSCSKDFLKSYDKRILGTWEIIDIDRFGFNGADALPFDVGDLFTFKEDGDLTYERSGNIFQGSWDIQREVDDDTELKALEITAINFTTQQIRSEYFNDMRFTGTDRFVATIYYNTRSYVYRFKRQ